MKTYVFGVVHLCLVSRSTSFDTVDDFLAHVPAPERWLVEEVSRRFDSTEEAMGVMREWNFEGGGVERLCTRKKPSAIYWLKRVEEDGRA